MKTEELTPQQTKILENFSRLIKGGKLAHAYLLFGPSRIGKFDAALALAKMLNCEGKASSGEFFCGDCGNCHRIAALSHPDVKVIEAEEGTTIKIEQVRGLMEAAALRAFMAKVKVFIIRDCEKLTMEGANALLKTLEEPSGDSLLILTSSNTENVIDTIRSRCHAMGMFPDDKAAVAGRLQKEGVTAGEDDALFLAAVAEGCLGRARFLQEEKFLEQRDRILDLFITPMESDPEIKELSKNKEKTKIAIDVLISWTRDCMLLNQGAGEGQLMNRDRVNELKEFAERFRFNELTALHERVVEAKRAFNENLNVRIPLLIIKEGMAWVKR